MRLGGIALHVDSYYLDGDIQGNGGIASLSQI
jgi:hypothetical protein